MMPSPKFHLTLRSLIATALLMSPSVPSQTRRQRVQASSPVALTARQIARKVLPSVVYIAMQDSHGKQICFGSGFFITRNLILTNKHVISCSGTTHGSINIAGSKQAHSITTMLAWPDLDLALVEAKDLIASPLSLSSQRQPAAGDDIFVAGNPEGLEGTFTRGIISSVRLQGGLLQIDAPVSPGSSGGPVVDVYGRVVGITVSTFTEGQNLNFAIPAASLVTPLARMQQMFADLRHKNAATAVSTNSSKVETSPPTGSPANPARQLWDAQRDWSLFMSDVNGDSTIKDNLKALLDSGLSVNTKDKHGWTALHVAALLAQVELSRFLLSRGADINDRDKDGRTPLMLAATLDEIHWDAINGSPWQRLWTESLCSSEPPNYFTVSNDDLLVWYLKAQDQQKMLQFLLDAGADVTLTNNKGQTALDYAAASGPADLDRLISHARKSSGQQPTCDLRLEQSPALRGFRLGMSLREVLSHFRRFEMPETDTCGRLNLDFNDTYGWLRDLALRPAEFEGILRLRMTFVDERLAYLQMMYDHSPWKSTDDYLAALSNTLTLPGKWQRATQSTDIGHSHIIGCDGFKVMAGTSPAPYVELHDMAALRMIIQRKLDGDARKRREQEQQREQRKREFKP
jgi:S1-C subfamily serine protease